MIEAAGELLGVLVWVWAFILDDKWKVLCQWKLYRMATEEQSSSIVPEYLALYHIPVASPLLPSTESITYYYDCLLGSCRQEFEWMTRHCSLVKLVSFPAATQLQKRQITTRNMVFYFYLSDTFSLFILGENAFPALSFPRIIVWHVSQETWHPCSAFLPFHNTRAGCQTFTFSGKNTNTMQLLSRTCRSFSWHV